jgi:glycosyltransferase involved in cell wall biosynthesis
VESDADIVFFYAAQQWTFDAAWPSLQSMRAHKVLVPCGYSGLYDPLYRRYFEDLKPVLTAMDAVVYHARSYRDYEFGEALGLKNAVVIPNGADLAEFNVELDRGFRRELGAADSAFVILTVGTFTGLKGHLELAQAFLEAEFGDRDALLILNGNWPERSGMRPPFISALTSLVSEYGLIYTIRHLTILALNSLGISVGKTMSIKRLAAGINKDRSNRKRAIIVNLPRTKLVQAYLQSDLFVFASNIEYSPLVLFEACAAGLPFLTVPVGNTPEIVAWTGGGELCEAPVDERGYTRVQPHVLGEKISAMSRDSERLKTLGRSGRDKAIKRFNWDTLAGEYESLFQQLCARLPPREDAVVREQRG